VKDLLAPQQAAVLEELARSEVCLGFDFDGTLAPIVPDPARAALRPTTRTLLARVAELFPAVVISGRAAAAVAGRLEGIALRGIVGNHGIEPWRASESVRLTVHHWSEDLAPQLARLEGVELEDKGYSLAIHYRHAPRREEVLASIARAVADLGDVRVVGGKEVVNVLPLGAPHKGVALERERDRLGCHAAFFLGDDETDEDVFALERPGRLWSVRVGASPLSRAAYFVPTQEDVDRLLERLIQLRAAGT